MMVFKEDFFLRLDERDQVSIVVDLNNENALSGILTGVGMLNDIQQLAFFNVEDDLFE